MSQSLNQTTRNTFVKGLLTEFSELNFPTEGSIDELNCSLFKAGNRTKRLGLEYETSYQLSSDTFPDSVLFGTHTWSNVDNDPDVEYLVVQANATLYFYQKSSNALSGGLQSFTVDLTSYEFSGGTGAGTSHIDVASVNGRLVVVSPQINAFYIEKTSGGINSNSIHFKTRDFGFYSDPDTLASKISTNTRRTYDTRNAGWIGDKGAAALSTYNSAKSGYPPLTHPWYSGKDSDGNFDVAEWEKVYSGNTTTATGHYVINPFAPSRGFSTYHDGTSIDDPTGRFSCVAAFAGRVFFSGAGSKVYFSQILEGMRNVGDLYQINDPTAEDFSSLLDTDGGWVSIPEAAGISRLQVFGSALLVFARNGVWRVSGVDNVFRATEYSIYKVTSNGLAQSRSLVFGKNSLPFWWSYTGIHTIQVTDQGGLVEIDISKDTIQSFWDSITGTAKSFVIGEYDSYNDRISWFYPNDNESVEYKLNNILFLDVPLGAFYPWKISDKDSNTPQVVGTSFFTGGGADSVVYNVVDSSGNAVVDSLGNQVTITRTAASVSASALTLLVKDSSGKLTFAEFTGNDFLDWNTEDYSSYAEAAYNFVGDLTRKKNSPYVTIFLRTTETGWEVSGNGYTPIRNSSCKVTTFWDFKKEASSVAQEAYRFKQPLIVDSNSLGVFDYPTTVISSRLKTRGRGRVMRLRFEASAGKDFNLLGWETIDAVNRTI